MEIVDLDTEYQGAYINCLEEWSDEMKESGNHKACWYHKYEKIGLRVKLAVDERKEAIGMIQYLPIEDSVVSGEGLYFIPCIWVHGHTGGVGNRQGKGIGSALLEAAENDAKARGARGMAAWGLRLPFWMRASWFKKHGYKKADRDALRLLVVKSFNGDVDRPRWIRQRKKVTRRPGIVTVTAFINGWCNVQNIVYERTKRACATFGGKVSFVSIDTSERESFLEWGISDAIFVDGKRLQFGPPLSYDKIEKKSSNASKEWRDRRLDNIRIE